MPWNPDTYHKFQSERAAPFEDLVALIKIREGLQVVDLGCGTGELTRKLADRLPGSDVTGIDNSPEMLAKANEHSRPGLCFEQGAKSFIVFEKVYPHVLADADAMADWTSGTALVPYFERMTEPVKQAFMAEYRKRLRARWPSSPVFYAFRRTLFAATRE